MNNSLSQAKFADMIGKSAGTVSRAVRSGRLPSEGNGAARGRRVVVEVGEGGDIRAAAVALWDATASPMPHHQARKDGLEEVRTAASTNPPEKTPQIGDSAARQVDAAPPAISFENELSIEEIQKRTKIAVMRHQEASALDKENEAKRRAGDLYEREAVESAWVDALVTFRTTLETMPDRVAPAIARHRGDVAAIHHELSDAVVVLMQDLADGFRRRMSRDS